MLNTITLTARVVDATHFVFIPQTWEKELKPYKQARWSHDTARQYGTHNYDIKEGHFLAFVQFDVTQGGFYAAHIYAAVKEMQGCQQIHATITKENGLVLETVGCQNTGHPHSPCLHAEEHAPFRSAGPSRTFVTTTPTP